MPFDVGNDDELDLENLFSDIVIPDANMYIADENKAVELLAELIANKKNTSIRMKRKIEYKINKLFSLFSEVTIENKTELYNRFLDLCSRLSERQKYKNCRIRWLLVLVVR